MDTVEYDRMAALEGSMWWYHGLHGNVLNALVRYAPGLSTLLDAGCGTGGTLMVIKDRFPKAALHGLDISEQACAYTRTKSGANVEVGSVDALPYPERSFDAMISCDVLGYEMDVDAAVSGFLKVLKPGGKLVLNLAAYQWMLSYHDRSVGQVKRFTRAEAVALLERHGFHVLFSTYWNTVLFPLMMLRRKVLPDPGKSDVDPFHPWVNGIFKSCLAAERFLTDKRIPLPFGGSVLLIAERPN